MKKKGNKAGKERLKKWMKKKEWKKYKKERIKKVDNDKRKRKMWKISKSGEKM